MISTGPGVMLVCSRVAEWDSGVMSINLLLQFGVHDDYATMLNICATVQSSKGFDNSSLVEVRGSDVVSVYSRFGGGAARFLRAKASSSGEPS